MDADGERRLMIDASGPGAGNARRFAAPRSPESPVPERDGPGWEDAGRHPHGLHPHPVPAFIAFVVARLLEARRPDVLD
jgi:hypothetical protein